ncbi:MAG: hypothetical protein JO257_24230 [Deltaproteobacteria bacterium]|nr:hypothetical protein [Deltaproteobacteria bacterium]
MKAVLVAAIACACQSHGGGSDDELAQAKATTQTFFDALDKADCATLGSLVPAAEGSAACAKFVHEWHEELALRLVEIADVRRDGRDKHAIIVNATVMRRGNKETLLLRETHDAGVWRIVL